MNKLRIGILAGAMLVLAVVGTIFADFDVVTYDDVEVEDYEPSAGGLGSYVLNGDFTLWNADGLPQGWTVWAEGDAGWETHIGRMALGPVNNGMAIFIRHTGGSGSEYAGMYQKLDTITSPGNYWADLHITAWEQGVTSAYNSVAWYGIGTSDSPGSVTQWRELFPDVRVCPNGDGVCNYLARKETLWIDPGSYLHVQVGHKFPDFGAFTVFGLDDFSIVDANGTTDQPDGWIDDGDVTWDPSATR
ncbi:MAG TPA: hypothetical protein VF177_11930 [Anaerolineae bacterium]